MNDRDERILDTCLDEVLGDRQPPDLSARILAALRSGQPASPAEPPVVYDPFEPVAPPIQAPPIVVPPSDLPSGSWSVARPNNRGGRSIPAFNAVAVAASVVAAGVGIGLVVLSLSRDADRRSPMAQTGEPGSSAAASPEKSPRAGDAAVTKSANGENRRPGKAKSGVGAALDRAIAQSVQHPASKNDKRGASGQSPTPRKPAFESPNRSNDDSPRLAANQRPTESGASLADASVISLIDQDLRRAWDEYGVTPSEPASDEEWCRRTFLRLVGRIPSVDELRRFVDGSAPDRRAKLVDELVSGARYADEFAAHWADVWANVLVGRKLSRPDEVARRDGLVEYLKNALRENKPFDRLAFDLLSATGSNKPGDEQYNGAVNFLLAHAKDDKQTQATSRVARIFLGTNLQCGQCHEHPVQDQIAQQQFWQLNAFFRQMRVEKSSDGTARLVNQDFKSEKADVDEAAVYYEESNGKLRAAFPVFLDGSELAHSGRVDEVDRRTELARMVSQSPWYRRAVVNRIWSQFLGFGLSNPVDDIGPHNPASHPQLLEQLAEQFGKHGYDVRATMRWIALSEGFGLSSKASGNSQLVDAPESGRPPLFARYYSRPMQAEQLFDSLRMLADARRNSDKRPGTDASRQAFLAPLARRLGPDAVNDDKIVGGNLARSLVLVDGELPQRVMSKEQGTLLDRVVRNDKMTVDEKIEHLFEASSSRRPTGQELRAARDLINTSPADPANGLADLWWALLNSNEFLLDH